MQDESTWMHPKEIAEKLTDILNRQQIEDQDGYEIIQITKKLITNAEESLQMIESRNKEVVFFKFIDEATQEKMNEDQDQDQDQEYDDIEDEEFELKPSIPNLPPIKHQNFCEKEQSAEMFSQQIQDIEMEMDEAMEDKDEKNNANDNNIKKFTNYITPMKIQPNGEQPKDGEMTPNQETKSLISTSSKRNLKML